MSAVAADSMRRPPRKKGSGFFGNVAVRAVISLAVFIAFWEIASRLKWPWIRTVLTSGAPLEEDLDKAMPQVRFMPKPWRALEVLMEAEKAAASSRYETVLSRTDANAIGALRA